MVDRDGSQETRSDEIGGQSDPLALRLVTPDWAGAVIGPEHPLYALALLAWRDRYRRPARAQEIAAGLARPGVWPRIAGERPTGDVRALTAASLAADGQDTGDVATALAVQPDTARRLVKRGRELLTEPPRSFAPCVEQVGTATQPAALTLLQSWPKDEEHAKLHAVRTGVREHV
jgi:hypothetical protein